MGESVLSGTVEVMVSKFQEANQLVRSGKLEEAVAAYRTATEENAGFYGTYQNLGETLWKLGRLDEAIAAFRHVVELNPRSVWGLYQLGELLRQQKQFEEAVIYLRRAVEIKSDVGEFYQSLGAALVELGSLEEAVEYLRRAVKLNPLPEAYYYLGVAQSQQQHWSEAVEYYRQGLEINPGDVDGCLGLAEALSQLGKWSEAVDSYRQVLTLSESGEVMFRLGQALGQLEQWEKAIAEYQRAINLGFAGAEVRHHLGYALSQLGRYEEAVVELRQVVEENPRSAQVRHQLGYALSQLQRWREAEVELRKVAELHPGSAVVWQQLGDVLQELGNRDEAEKVYRQALESRKSGYSSDLNRNLPQVRGVISASKSQNKKSTCLNVLFVLYGNIDSNGGYHAQLHGTRLLDQGVDCLFAVPDSSDNEDVLRRSLHNLSSPIRILPYSELFIPGSRLPFTNGYSPDVIHAWTPREIVRKCVEKLQKQYSCPLVIHLEDNEEYLTEAKVGIPFAELAKLPEAELDKIIPGDRYHPIKGKAFLKRAQGLTMIIETLKGFNIGNVPELVLGPPVDESLFYPRPINQDLRRSLGIPESHVVLAYTGNVHSGNRDEVRELYQAVEILNQQGCPTVLLRSGLNGEEMEIESWGRSYEKYLGWVEREQVPEILAAADVLVQPGVPGVFNDQRIPSKLLEYFAMGRPVVLPKTNLGLRVKHRQSGYVLARSDAQGIAGAVQEIKADGELARRLSDGAVDFYLSQLEQGLMETKLNDFYGRLTGKVSSLRDGKRLNREQEWGANLIKPDGGSEKMVIEVESVREAYKTDQLTLQSQSKSVGKLVSVVLGSYNRLNLIKQCIEAVRKELLGCDYEMIVIDGGSDDGAIDWLVEQKDIITIVQHNRGQWQGKPIQRKSWGYFMNLAFKCGKGKYICMLSDDSVILPGAILNGVNFFESEINKGNKIGAVAFFFRDYPVRKKYSVACNLGHIYVNHGLYLRDALEEVNYASEEFHFYFADTDLILKMKEKGYQCIPCPDSYVEHYFEATPEIRQSNQDEKKQLDRSYLIQKWCGKAYPEKKRNYYEKHIGRWLEKNSPKLTKTLEKLKNTDGFVFDDCEEEPAVFKVTVATVAFNAANLLEKTVKSVIQQRNIKIEYLIIDGGSYDQTSEVVSKYISSIDKFISESDRGIYHAMNKAINLATGNYVIFMNAGDTFANEFVVNNVFKDRQRFPDVIYGDRVYCIPNNSSKKQQSMPIQEVHRKMPYCHNASFVKLQVLRRFPFNETFKYAGDYNQVVEMYKSGCSFEKIDLLICNYLAGGKSESGMRPHLEVIKIQMDNFTKEEVRQSHYFKYYINNFKKSTDDWLYPTKINLDGIDINQVLYPEKFYLRGKTKSQKEEILKRWLNDFVYCSYDFGEPCNIDFIFFRSMMKRDDYKQFFHRIIDCCPGQFHIVEDYRKKTDRVNLEAQSFWEESKYLYDFIDGHSQLDKDCLYTRLCYYVFTLKKIKKFNFKSIVFHADMQPVENLMSQYFRKKGYTTVTLQHGLYVEYDKLDTVNVVNYKHQPSEYFLAWGQETIDLVSKYNPGNKFVICGKPEIYMPSQRITSDTDKYISVILDQHIFTQQNNEMLNIVCNFATRRGITVKVRFHPQNNKKEYFNSFSMIEEEQNIVGSEFIVGHTSSLLYEALLCSCKVYQYRSGMPAINAPDEMLFSTEQELESKSAQPFNVGDFAKRLIEFTAEDSLERYRAFFENILHENPRIHSCACLN